MACIPGQLPSKWLKILQILWVLSVCFSQIENLFYLVFANVDWKIAAIVSWQLNCFSRIIFTIIVLMTRKSIFAFFDDILSSIPDSKRRRLKRISWILTITYIVYAILWYLASIFMQDDDRMLKVVTHFSTLVNSFNNWLAGGCFIYIYLIRCLGAQDTSVLQSTDKCLKRRHSFELIQGLWTHESKMEKKRSEFQRLFGFVPFFVLLNNFAGVPGLIARVSNSNATRMSIADYAIFVLADGSEILVCFWLIFETSSYWKKTVDRKRRLLQQLISKMDTKADLNRRLDFMILHQEMSRLLEAGTPFTGIGLFNIDFDLFASFASAIITFSVLILQLQQQFDESHNKTL